MSSTMNLIKKHIATSIFTKLNIIIFLLLSIYWFTVPHMSIFAGAYLVYYFCFMPFIEEERNKGSEQMICMPLKKSEIVVAKYICNAGVLITLGLMSFISTFFNFGLDSNVGLLLLLINICAPTLILSIFMPLTFKFGVQPIIHYVLGFVFILGFCGSFLFAFIISGNIIINFSNNFLLLFLIAIIASIFLYLVSLKVSLRIFNKREFK